MADRTFESQQFASQEAARGEESLRQGIGALHAGLTQAGAALERHGDRKAQREQFGAQLGEQARQADQSAAVRREEIGEAAAGRKQRGEEFDRSLSVQTRQGDEQAFLRRQEGIDAREARSEAQMRWQTDYYQRVQQQELDTRLRMAVEARAAFNQQQEAEARMTQVVMAYESQQQAMAEGAQRMAHNEKKFGLLVNAQSVKNELAQQELLIEQQKHDLAVRKAQFAQEQNAPMIGSMKQTEVVKVYGNLLAILEKASSAGLDQDPKVVDGLRKQVDYVGGLLNNAMDPNPTIGPRTNRPPPPQFGDGVGYGDNAPRTLEEENSAQGARNMAAHMLADIGANPNRYGEGDKKVAQAIAGNTQYNIRYSNIVARQVLDGVDTRDVVTSLNQKIAELLAEGYKIDQILSGLEQ